MKIMYVVHSLGHMGGAEKVLVTLANYFASKENEVIITILSDDKIIFELDKKIKILNYHQKKKSFFRQIKYIRESIRICEPDIVIGFITSTNILTTIAAKLERIPVILSEHTSYDEAFYNKHGQVSTIVWQLLRRILYPMADKLLILTNEDKPKYHYVDKIEIIPNPLVLKHMHNNIQRENIILGVGRLHEVKGFDMLIRAFSKINREGWKLVIAGEGSERNTLETLINRLNIADKVELPGLIDDMELYYKKSSIYVLSSRSEGYPGGLCEAMGYGCASIAFNCPTGPKEIISHKENGFLVQANDIDKLGIAIQNLIDNKKIREKLGMNAKKISDQLKIETIGTRWYDCMVQAIDK